MESGQTSTGREDIAANVAFIKDQRRWPLWPILPVKRRELEETRFGYIEAGRGSVVFVGNPFRAASVERHAYTSYESLVLDGWRVD